MTLLTGKDHSNSKYEGKTIEIFTNVCVRVRVRAQKMACGCVRCTSQFFCNVREGAGQNCCTRKVFEIVNDNS